MSRTMHLSTRCLPLLLAGLLWCAFADRAQAQHRGHGGTGFGVGAAGGGLGGGFAYGGWWTGLPYGFAQPDHQLPYFTKYPPVYYSYPVARPYGYSPFAYPPGYITPEAQQAPAPSDVENPFVPQQGTKPTSTSDRTVSTGPTPKVILNPYVDEVQLTSDR